MQRNPSLTGRITVLAGITLAIFTMWPILRYAGAIDHVLGRDAVNYPVLTETHESKVRTG